MGIDAATVLSLCPRNRRKSSTWTRRNWRRFFRNRSFPPNPSSPRCRHPESRPRYRLPTRTAVKSPAVSPAVLQKAGPPAPQGQRGETAHERPAAPASASDRLTTSSRRLETSTLARRRSPSFRFGLRASRPLRCHHSQAPSRLSTSSSAAAVSSGAKPWL